MCLFACSFLSDMVIGIFSTSASSAILAEPEREAFDLELEAELGVTFALPSLDIVLLALVNSYRLYYLYFVVICSVCLVLEQRCRYLYV